MEHNIQLCGSPPPTLSHGLDRDDFSGISSACSGDSHHPDTVLTVPAQVGDAVEEHIWGCLELAAHLGGYVQGGHNMLLQIRQAYFSSAFKTKTV